MLDTAEKSRRLGEKKIKGEKAVKIVLDNDKFIIYEPTSKDGAIYWGRNTKWCTAADEHNRFDHYRKDGVIYIVIVKPKSKKDPIIKYQIHFESNQVMNAQDQPVDIMELIGKIEFPEVYPNDVISAIHTEAYKQDDQNIRKKLLYKYRTSLYEFYNIYRKDINEKSIIKACQRIKI
jgi:hypothetical protein